MKNRILKALEIKSLRENCINSLHLVGKNFDNNLFLPKLNRFLNKYLYPICLGSTFDRYGNAFIFYSSNLDKKLYKNYNQKDIFCNFGSGSFFHKRWTNFDFKGKTKFYKILQGKEGRDFFHLNLCEENLKLPYKDNSVSLIYCSHTLEHIENKYANIFLKECKRILKNNGVLRLAMPNTIGVLSRNKILNSQKKFSQKMIYDVLLSSCKFMFSDIKKVEKKEIINIAKKTNFSSTFSKLIEKKQFYFNSNHPEKHISYWDHEKLVNLSKELGFKFYVPLLRGHSTVEPFLNLNVFDLSENHLSLYGELIK